ncbi:MAG: TIGR02452 family protein [Erysipelotrichaceae bacterium]|nr:TIGR02452 family protein [Erysipelotrichaceae bacterium]
MSERRKRLKEIFRDTQKQYAGNEKLQKDALYTYEHNELIPENDYPQIRRIYRPGKVSVSEERTFECAMRLMKEHPEYHIAVLNFASSVHPGGGVIEGASAQEECLCRCSTLYASLNQPDMMKQYYVPNRDAMNPLANDGIIFSPAVTVFKSDTEYPEILPEEKWIHADVLTCAAPNLRSCGIQVTDRQLYEIHLQRAEHILHTAAAKGCDALVLGAFGCGAFANNPETVARAYRDALMDYASYFEEIVFAVYCTDEARQNYHAFADELADWNSRYGCDDRLLWKAMQIACRAHEGQKDKGGNPYFLHPVFVSQHLETIAEKIVGLLHDVVEDTDITIEDLRKEGFPEHVLEAVDTITKKDGVSYEEYIEGVMNNPIARAVKIQDVRHNSDISRIPHPTEHDLKRLEKYRKTLKKLEGRE